MPKDSDKRTLERAAGKRNVKEDTHKAAQNKPESLGAALPGLMGGMNLAGAGAFTAHPMTLKRDESINRFMQNPEVTRSKTVRFSQDPLKDEVTASGQNKALLKAIDKYQGLCDIICNYIVINDLFEPSMEQDELIEKAWNELKSLTGEKNRQRLEKDYAPLHVLKLATVPQLMKAVLFNELPHNVVDKAQQKALDNLTQTLTSQTAKILNIVDSLLKDMDAGQYIKVCPFTRSKAHFQGHTMVVRKNGPEDYTFFDPDRGFKLALTKADMQDELLSIMRSFSKEYQSICFLDASKQLQNELKSVRAKPLRP